MKLTITSLLALTLNATSLMGCGAFSDATKLEIQMYGIAATAEGASGERDPQFQTYQVKAITLIGETENIQLLEAESSFKIVDRPQILVAKTADDYVNGIYTGLTVVFASTVTGGDQTEGELSFELPITTLLFDEAITIEQSKTKTFYIKASWANSIGGGVMTPPTLTITSK